MVIEWFQQLRARTEDFKSDEESRRMREAGNDSYRKERHALKACDLYTEAIFLAPSQDSIAAAMAHANRSTVLHDCGMHEVRTFSDDDDNETTNLQQLPATLFATLLEPWL